MTNEMQTELARAMRREGEPFRVIAERLGISRTTVHRRLNPEVWREREKARNAEKRAWEQKHNRWPCPECGRLMGVGQKPSRSTCLACRQAHVAAEDDVVVAGYLAGVPVAEIAGAMGKSYAAVATRAARLRRGGRIPVHPYFARGRDAVAE